MELWLATNNRNKVTEFKSILTGLEGFELHGALELPTYSAPNENGHTFADNARIKAKFLSAVKPDAWIVADDSGIEVDALKGLPGVHSARYAGPKARDIENNLKLLKQIQLQSSGQNRSARFRCVLCLLSPKGEEQIFEGVLEGQIARDLKGTTGFGYDPIFIPEGENKTIAELGLAVKNKLSHRAKAFRLMKEFLQSRVTAGV